MKHISRPVLEFIKWDIRGTIATLVALAVLVGLGWAAVTNPLYTLDFGTASFDDLAPGAVQVKGGLSSYPQTSGTLLFGWQTSSVQEFTDKGISNKLNRDYNGSSSAVSNIFKLGGLEPGTYRFRFVSGSAKTDLSTRIRIGSQAISLTTNNNWKTGDIVHETLDGTVGITLSSADGVRSWGICVLQIFAEAGTAPEPSLELNVVPAEHQVSAGGTAAYNVGLTPINNYAGGAQLSISGLVSGLTARFMPANVASLPATVELQVSTSSTTVPTKYSLLVRALGTGAEPVTRTIVASLVVTKTSIPGQVVVPGTPGTDGQVSPTDGSTGIIDFPPRTEVQVKEEFALVEKFAQEEQKKLLQRKEFLELGEIGYELGPISIMPELPKPKTTFEGVLQGLVQSGIIQSTVDVAPPSEPARDGFWVRFMKTLFPPVS